MKPIVTWVLVANSGSANIVANHGPNKGFAEVAGKSWSAEAPVEYADKPGTERGSNSYGSVTFSSGNPKDAAETAFAVHLAAELNLLSQNEHFDRLIITAAPSLLGKLRTALTDGTKTKIIAEVAKDLTHVSVKDLPNHLEDIIAA